MFVLTTQLIDQGMVNVGDIESELGVSSESLEAALVVIGTQASIFHKMFYLCCMWMCTRCCGLVVHIYT